MEKIKVIITKLLGVFLRSKKEEEQPAAIPAEEPEKEIVAPIEEIEPATAPAKECIFLEFSEEDVENVLNAIRPLIKNLNSDEIYAKACTLIAENKVLKTYAKLSEDKKVLSITLTSNKVFNQALGYAEMFFGPVIEKFESTINSLEFGVYDLALDPDQGAIIIHKIG